MPTIKKILFPVDFSEGSFAAARYVEAVAGLFEAEIMLLHVVGMGEHTLAEELLPGRQAQLELYMADELKYFTTERVCVTANDAAAAIADVAWRWKPDLVMMPTHGMGAFRRFLIGSVAAKVLNDLDCPVWTSAHLEKALRLEEIHCRRILCAVDLGERSGSILKWAAWLADQYRASVGIVHAAPDLPVAHYGWNRAEEFAQRVTEDTARRIEILQKEAGTTAQVFVNSGDPAKVAIQAVRDFDADLLVIGRHGGESAYLRQNAYAILCDAPCPVISI
jgi:nucleotide-binding universal stress UspA family protein